MSALLATAPPAPRLQRARGRSRVAFKQGGPDGSTRLADLFQDGCCKIRLPRVYDDRGPIAVLINTAGGITGGDDLVNEAVWAEGTIATVTSQAAERIYRRTDGVGRVLNRLTVGAGSRACWLPQETIVFEGAGLSRRMEVDLAADASFTAVESIVLGRTAMGEDVRTVELADHWRVRRDGRLVYADALRLVGDSRAALAGTATGGGCRAFATVLHAAADAEARLDGVRALLDALGISSVEAGVSAFDGLLVARLLAVDGRALRALLMPLLEHLADGPLPRTWSI